MPKENIPDEKQTARGRGHEEAVEKLKRRAEMVRTLHEAGLSNREISQKTGFTVLTVCNYLSDNFTPVNAHYGKQREGKLEPLLIGGAVITENESGEVEHNADTAC